MPEETLTDLFSCEFCKISKNTFSYRTLPVAASGCWLYRGWIIKKLGWFETRPYKLLALRKYFYYHAFCFTHAEDFWIWLEGIV